MKRIRWRRCAGATVALSAVVLALPAPARGQSGPLTESLELEEPKTFSFRIGPVLVSPNLTIRDFGYDTNVFNEAENPKKDWTITLTPEFRMFARLGLVQVVGLAAGDLRYFKEYESERSVSRQFRGRVDAQLSRFRPWFSGAYVDLTERPNREVDLRARNTGTEVAAGLSFNLSPIAGVFGMVSRVDDTFDDGQAFEGVDLATALNRRAEAVSGGIKIQATPFTTVLFSGTLQDDKFDDAQRNSRNRSVEARFEIAPEAILRGKAMVGYQDFRPEDPVVPAYKGVVASGTLAYTLLGRATVETRLLRDVTYSFDTSDAYFVETRLDLLYTQLLSGPYDVQFGGSRSRLDYTRTRPGVKPSVDAFQAGVGYNFQDKSRLGLSFEYSQRIDDERPDNRYHNRRFFASYEHGLAR